VEKSIQWPKSPAKDNRFMVRMSMRIAEKSFCQAMAAGAVCNGLWEKDGIDQKKFLTELKAYVYGSVNTVYKPRSLVYPPFSTVV
jgi:hypothetical protein